MVHASCTPQIGGQSTFTSFRPFRLQVQELQDPANALFLLLRNRPREREIQNLNLAGLQLYRNRLFRGRKTWFKEDLVQYTGAFALHKCMNIINTNLSSKSPLLISRKKEFKPKNIEAVRSLYLNTNNKSVIRISESWIDFLTRPTRPRGSHSRTWGLWGPSSICNDPWGCLLSKNVSETLCALCIWQSIYKQWGDWLFTEAEIP